MCKLIDSPCTINFIVHMQLVGHPSLVVSGESHDIYTNYKYQCGEESGVVHDIRITLKPVGELMSVEYQASSLYT